MFPAHPSPTHCAAVFNVTLSAKYFITVDALHRYWEMELFITPYRRYKHYRGPMGFAATGNAFRLRGGGGRNPPVRQRFPTHLQRINQMFTRYCISLNTVVTAPSVNFSGCNISAKDISADEDNISAICDLTNLTDLRSFMGLVNQLMEFTPDVAATASTSSDGLQALFHLDSGP